MKLNYTMRLDSKESEISYLKNLINNENYDCNLKKLNKLKNENIYLKNIIDENKNF